MELKTKSEVTFDIDELSAIKGSLSLLLDTFENSNQYLRLSERDVQIRYLRLLHRRVSHNLDQMSKILELSD